MSNSSLVNYTKISPNRSAPRSNVIDTITIHMVVGQCTVEALGDVFAPVSRQASSNYGVGFDGRIGLYCPESDRSWCSSSPENDNRAITIETASDTYAPYAVNKAAYDSLIKLCADICKRNGKTKMIWCGSLAATNARKFAKNEMRMTLHKWFADTLCPGEYLESHMADIAHRVNKLLAKEEKKVVIKDMKKTDKYYKYCKTCAEAGLLKLDKKGNFNPDKPVTKKMLALVLCRLWKLYHQ